MFCCVVLLDYFKRNSVFLFTVSRMTETPIYFLFNPYCSLFICRFAFESVVKVLREEAQAAPQ
jgi:hypothetical protein